MSNGRGRTALLTRRLLFACAVSGFGSIIYGYDGGSFSGLQSIPSFAREFGVKSAKGTYALSTGHASFLNSIAYIGKGIGALVGSPIVTRLGHRWGIFILCITALVGTVVQVTAHSVAQFAVSRIILYGAIGLVETCVSTYQSEITPAPIRGMMVASLQLGQSPGGLLASGINRAFSKNTRPRAWVIPASIQFIFPFIILLGLYWCPDSPRWLLSKGRKEDALKELKVLRSKEDFDSGACEAEIEAMQEEIESHRATRGTWSELFEGTNRRRTGLACGRWIFQQSCGSTFVSSYAVPFWISSGLAANAFNYSLALSGAGFVGVLIGTQLYDRVGRKRILLFGSFMLFAIDLSFAGIGVHPNYTHSTGLATVAPICLFSPAYVACWGAVPYILTSEIGTCPLREKTFAFAATVGVIAQFTTSYVTPYLLAKIHAKLGFVFGAVALISFIWVYVYIPETKNRSLEEIDEMFAARLPASTFKSFKSVGAAHAITELEAGHVAGVVRDGSQSHDGSLKEKDAAMSTVVAV